ncbi:DUF4197 domain-containing protein [Robiginitalea sp. SC105]|uniref:DUF4197 domain-containing protein n=1 Tax=Robiginitalea sp. SC105 TaxID=2762332 RepID=UPI001639E159|nr:DUF4197 domain-containing protein [Robiginitalea sp. SC105]MBC2839883.1 DUF4197 domain-containing protein [Robiginitalea sp. SC105]
MHRRLFSILICLTIVSCGELQQVIDQFPEGGGVTEAEIAQGLRQALNQGIEKQVAKLAAENGFYGDEQVRILLPEQLQKVDRTLRNIGLDQLADEGLLLLNRAAEDAVGRATPIFVDAVSGITFAHARDILLGNDNAATSYLKGRTEIPLYDAFRPVIKGSFERVGADRVWGELISRYNRIPLVQPVNPDLADYVTREALQGVYEVIAREELEIRTRISSRSTLLMKKVFALQDGFSSGP